MIIWCSSSMCTNPIHFEQQFCGVFSHTRDSSISSDECTRPVASSKTGDFRRSLPISLDQTMIRPTILFFSLYLPTNPDLWYILRVYHLGIFFRLFRHLYFQHAAGVTVKLHFSHIHPRKGLLQRKQSSLHFTQQHKKISLKSFLLFCRVSEKKGNCCFKYASQAPLLSAAKFFLCPFSSHLLLLIFPQA